MDFLDSILNNIDEALVITDAEGKILLFNEVASVQSKSLLLGKPLTVGEYVQNTAHSSRGMVVQRIIHSLRENKRPEKSFAEYPVKQGSTVYLEFDYLPILSDTNEVTHICLFIRDITPNKVFEKKFMTEARNNSNLIEKANAVVIGVDALGYITDWNEHCTNITGFKKHDVYAQKLAKILVSEAGGNLNNPAMSTHEIILKTKDGKNVTLLLSGTPRTTTTGEVIGFTYVGQDVTELAGYRKELERKVEERTGELKRALQKEQELVELKTRFVAIASHEFRTPLSTIQQSADFIKRNTSQISKEDVQNKMDAIQKQVMHMTHLLDDVLTYGKNESGKINLTLTNIEAVEFFNKVVEEIENSTKGTHKIITDFYNLKGHFAIDEKLLRNITINLLTNAIKFSPGRSYVELIVRKMSGDLIMTVRDEGIGIPPNEIGNIFEPFLRGKETESIQGTGLGLSIVKRAVELLNGSVQVESRHGSGTTFTVTIPLES
ncbi:MAG: hypothetical protein C0490_15875 [Marivirga sp.]|nr:hypothetical protein [Marivirga sp.]